MTQEWRKRNRKTNLQASKSSEYFLRDTLNSSSSMSSWVISISWQFLRNQILQGTTKVFTRRHTFLGVDFHRITQTPRWLIEHVYTHKHISLLTYKYSNHQNHEGALDALTISPFLVVDDKHVKFSTRIKIWSVSTEFEEFDYKI